MKALLLLTLGLIVGCVNQNGESTEYLKFIEENQKNERYFCSGGFLMREKFMSKDATKPQEFLVNTPNTRCDLYVH